MPFKGKMGDMVKERRVVVNSVLKGKLKGCFFRLIRHHQAVFLEGHQ